MKKQVNKLPVTKLEAAVFTDASTPIWRTGL